MHPLTWFSAPIDGKNIPIVLSCPELDPNLRGRHGVTVGEIKPFPRLARISINAADSRATQDWALFHELVVHGVLWSSPLRRSIETEECFARALDGRAFELLRRLGFRWPRRPAGVAELEAWARARLRTKTVASPAQRARSGRAR